MSVQDAPVWPGLQPFGLPKSLRHVRPWWVTIAPTGYFDPAWGWTHGRTWPSSAISRQSGEPPGVPVAPLRVDR